MSRFRVVVDSVLRVFDFPFVGSVTVGAGVGLGFGSGSGFERGSETVSERSEGWAPEDGTEEVEEFGGGDFAGTGRS